MDPWYGPTINTYSWVCSNSVHVWTHSLKLTSLMPTLAVSPSNQIFGPIASGTYIDQTLLITNLGAGRF